MDTNFVLSVTVVAMGAVAFAIVKLGDSYFNAVSRNPVINDQIKGMLLVLASMTELVALVMMSVAIYLAFVK